MKIGVIGAGQFAGSFIALWQLQPDVEAVWVTDVVAERATEHVERYGLAGAYGSVEELLASPTARRCGPTSSDGSGTPPRCSSRGSASTGPRRCWSSRRRARRGARATRSATSGSCSGPTSTRTGRPTSWSSRVSTRRCATASSPGWPRCTTRHGCPPSSTAPPTVTRGSRHFLADDFVRAVTTKTQPPVNAWRAARFTLPGVVAWDSALRDGVRLDVPDFGDGPPDPGWG